MQQGKKFFNALGVKAGDGGRWLREQCLILANERNTPVTDWLSMPMAELPLWIQSHNKLVREENRRREEAARRGR